MNGVIERFQILQSEGDVLCTSRLARAGLIKESFQSSSGGDSRMAMWCCWGTLPSLVLWGAPIICTSFFFYALVAISYFFSMCLFANDDSVYFPDLSLCLISFFIG